MASGRRGPTAQALETALAGGLRREFGRLTWTPALTAVRDTEPATIATADGIQVRVQLLSSTGWSAWPTESRDLIQRYADAPPARLPVPTLPAFVAMKTAAWFDRRAARDLYDLHLLAGAGAIDGAARDLYVRFGPTGRPPAAQLFTSPPSATEWHDQLAAQTRLLVTPTEAAATVGTAWAEAAGGP